jgi:hypothetical protein
MTHVRGPGSGLGLSIVLSLRGPRFESPPYPAKEPRLQLFTIDVHAERIKHGIDIVGHGEFPTAIAGKE